MLAVLVKRILLFSVMARLRLFLLLDRAPPVVPFVATSDNGARLCGAPARAESYSFSEAGAGEALLSIRQATLELERLWGMRRSCLVAGDLQYAMMTQDGLSAQLADELANCCEMGACAHYLDTRSLKPVAFLAVLLEIYCDALSHPSVAEQQEFNDDVMFSVAVRLAEASSMLAMFYWSRSEAPLPIVWRALAAAYGLVSGHEESVKVASPKCAAASKAEEDICGLVSRVLLLVLADPFSLNPGEILSADRLIAHHIPGILLGNCWSNGAVAFNLEAGSPLARQKVNISPRGFLVWLPVSQVVVSVQDGLTKRDRGVLPVFSGMGLDLPRMLVRRWTAFPSHRQSLRADAFFSSNIICGAMALIRAEKPSMRSVDDKPRRVGRAGILLDYSDTGCRIRFCGANYPNLVPGVLVGVELPFMRGLSAGVLCWVKRSSERYAEAGIRIIARVFEPVPLRLPLGRWVSGNLVEFGLLAVAELGSQGKGEVEIILQRNKVPFEGLEALKATNSGCDFYVQNVLEVGHDFLRIRAGILADRGLTEVELSPLPS